MGRAQEVTAILSSPPQSPPLLLLPPLLTLRPHQHHVHSIFSFFPREPFDNMGLDNGETGGGSFLHLIFSAVETDVQSDLTNCGHGEDCRGDRRQAHVLLHFTNLHHSLRPTA
ncbi:hypothetical protein MDA_GLEAN10007859 [Myotis davidii]|uniref:Uncharacterized protein n=1 Tax=Myotis davidii TaxID=225400 RepID=L5M8Q8_MYODS|nr:hypothetical protein MDA_GLEAN10007859 [Myotis davidii]